MTDTETLLPESRLCFVDELSRVALIRLQHDAASAADVERHFQDEMENGQLGPKLSVIPAGRFDMGSDVQELGHSPDEAPRHPTVIRKTFAIGVCPVLAKEFEVFRSATEWCLRPELIWHKGYYPVINVRMQDVKLYLEWLSAQTGKRYRLPTEAEWEYAARAGSTTPFYHGDDISCQEVHFNPFFPYRAAAEKTAWYRPRCFPSPKAAEVGYRTPNLWGLHDMHGNVWEFTRSHWTRSHVNANRDGSETLDADPHWYVTKGGSWFDPAERCRSAARKKRYLDELDTNLGFRVVREL